MINYYSNLFLQNTFLYFRYGNRMLYFLCFFIYSKSTNVETEYKYSQYCTPLSQSECRYFFVLAIKFLIHSHKKGENRNGDERDIAKWPHMTMWSKGHLIWFRGVSPWSHHPAKLSCQKFCESEDAILSICHVTSRWARDQRVTWL